MLTLRRVTRRDKGRQVRILTTSSPGELPAAGVVYRVTGRWREENWFRCGRAHFALGCLDSYAAAPDDPGRKLPNPAKTASAAVRRLSPASRSVQASGAAVSAANSS